jgi:flagellar basal-body rod modification protein FlgD
MQAASPVSAASSSSSAQSAFGLNFQSLLNIILTQLTYQDPLKPMDNFEFVSQLAQFAQLQQTQSMSNAITSLISAQSAMQAVTLLGKTVDFTPATGSNTTQTGTVQSVAFTNGQTSLTLTTSDNQTIANVALTSVTQVQN